MNKSFKNILVRSAIFSIFGTLLFTIINKGNIDFQEISETIIIFLALNVFYEFVVKKLMPSEN